MEQILVTRGNGTAVHIGIQYANGALAARCNGWPTDVRSSSVRVNKTALQPTCKKCLASMPTVEEVAK